MNKKLFLCTILTLSLLFSVTVFASSYSTSIDLDFRSTLTGSYRSFSGSTHKIANTLESRTFGTPIDNYCDFTLQKKVGSTETNKGTKTQNLKTVGVTYSSTYTGQSSGEF